MNSLRAEIMDRFQIKQVYLFLAVLLHDALFDTTETLTVSLGDGRGERRGNLDRYGKFSGIVDFL